MLKFLFEPWKIRSLCKKILVSFVQIFQRLLEYLRVTFFQKGVGFLPLNETAGSLYIVKPMRIVFAVK